MLEILLDNAAVVAVGAIALTLGLVLLTVAKNYHNVPPNQVAIISGRQRKVKGSVDAESSRRGYRVVRGGGFLLWPVLERVDYMSLNVMSFGVSAHGVPDKSGVRVLVDGIANVKVLSNEEALPLAVERFLGMTREQIQSVAKENLESNLRSIVGTLTIEEMNQSRESLQKQVMGDAVGDLSKLGLGVDLLNIQSIKDEQGYIESLGKKRTAEVKRDAAIGEAEANRATAVKTALADQESKLAQADAAKQISDANRDRDVAVARNAAQVEAEQARITIAAQVMAAKEMRSLNIATVEAEQARVEQDTKLQEFELKRRDAELRATTIVKAERDRDALLIAADATQQAAVREGEAERVRAEKAGQGQQARMEAEAKGRQAIAAAVKAEKEAEAAGARAMLLAEAEGTKARLLAEAEGALKKAAAFKELDEAGRFLMIMEASPTAIAALGEAFAKVVTPAAQAIGHGLGNIDEVRVVDFGGANGNGNVLTQLATLPVETLTKLAEKIDAAGLGSAVAALAKRVGVDLPEAKP